MSRGKLDRLRLIVNVTSLAASVLFIIGAAWLISIGASPDGESALHKLYGPLIKAWAAHKSLGPAGKAIALLAAAAALAIVVLALLLSFKFNVEDWAVVILAPPIYLLVAGIAFMFLSFAVSVVRSAFG
ncbi:MAG TPA: hypothetical protein VJZ26_17125 [Blastocatellia bacterium]|nr:hypothetical protein [Blastocatellia bacterium]